MVLLYAARPGRSLLLTQNLESRMVKSEIESEETDCGENGAPLISYSKKIPLRTFAARIAARLPAADEQRSSASD